MNRSFITRLAVLVLAVALPTVGAQGQWAEGLRTGLGLTEVPNTDTRMPFETPGESFPGSAFYYLEDAPQLTADIADLRQDSAAAGTADLAASAGIGAAAQAFRQTGGGLDKARALQCLSMAIYYEAASESHAGQQAVAQVVLNRVAHPAYPASVCGVVFQGSERKTGCQFTFTCDGSIQRKPTRASWARAQSVALSALAGDVYRPVGLATHYHTNYVNPYWASSLDYIRTIGAHRFYRWKGKAGEAGAFTMAYSGREPGSAASTIEASALRPDRAATLASPSYSPLVSRNEAQITASAVEPSAQAADAADNLPRSGRVREEYANSGRWIRDPAKRD